MKKSFGELTAFVRAIEPPLCFILHARRRAVLAAAIALLLVATVQRAFTQEVSFLGAQSAVPVQGLKCPRGVALDQAGDVLVADSNDSRVIVFPASGGPEFTVGSGLNGPNGVTVDRSGNIYIADSRNNRVVVVPADGGTQYTIGKGLHDPGGVAVDRFGNVFIADTENKRVVVVPAGGRGQYTIGSGLKAPRDVALDSERNLFIADASLNQVVVVPADGGSQYTVGSGLSGPSGVVVDQSSNVFISDSNNSRVVEVPAGGGSQITLPTSGLLFPYGVALDGSGNLYIVDHGGTIGDCPEPGATCKVVEWQRSTVDFGSIVMQQSSTLTLNYLVTQATKFGPVDIASSGDFTLGNSNTCTGTLPANSTCGVNIDFGPLELGERQGTVELTDSVGSVLVTTAVQGNGVTATATKLKSSPNPSSYGEAVTFTATVTSENGAPPNGENVWFADGLTILGTGSLKFGSASLTISTLPVGTTRVTAVYGGDSKFAGSTSSVVRQVVQ